ncbi:hypothetical protein V8F06_012860 [Rhypophila decipiens]
MCRKVPKSTLPKEKQQADQGNAPKRETSILVKIELAQPQKYVHETCYQAPETAQKPGPVAHRQSWSSSIQDGDIELVEFCAHPAVRGWAHSTEQLVPFSTNTSSFEDGGQETTKGSIHFHPPPKDQQIPDYKPIPLRTPFLAVLFVFIAGTFAFLEYQVHDLPPLRYSVIKQDVAGRAKQQNTSESIELNSIGKTPTSAPTSQSPPLHNPVSFVTITRAAPARRALMRAPEPEPDARPPDTVYPSPAAPVSYCGWYPPRWRYDLCSSNNTGDNGASQYLLWNLQEYIQTFVTDDPSWCPCRTSMEKWGSEEIENELHYLHDWWDTDDEGCKSVMIAIESVNYYKWGLIYTPATVTGEETEYRYYSYSTPPPQASSQIWPLPSKAAGGDIMLPMVVRTAGTEVMDVFGNKVKPTETATFPVNFYSKPPWGFGLLPPTTLPCYLKSNKHFWSMQECTSIPVSTTRSILWWQLPLSRPTLTSAVTAETGFSTTSSDVVGISLAIPTSTAQQGSSVQQQPVCTSCETSNMKSTVATSSPASETPAQEPSMTDSSAQIGSVTSSSSSEQELPATTTWPSSTRSQLVGPETDSESRSMTAEPEISTAHSSDIMRPESSSTTSLIPIGVLVPIGQSSLKPTTFISSTKHSSPQSLTTLESLSEQEATSPGLVAAMLSKTDTEHTTDQPGPSSHMQDETLTSNLNTATMIIVPSPRLSPHPSAEAINSLPVTISSQPSHNLGSHSIGYNSSNPNDSQQTSLLTSLPLAVTPTSSLTPTTPTTTRRNRPAQTPEPHPPGPVSPEVQSSFSNLRSEASYLLASVIPVLLTTLLSIPIQVFSSSLNCLLPFRGLTRHTSGAGGQLSDTLLLSRNPSLPSSQLTSFRFLRRYKDPLPFLNMMLGVLSLILVPISSEVIRLELTSDSGCDEDDFNNRYSRAFIRVCAFGLRKSGGLIRFAEVVLCVMGVLVLLLGLMLGRWRSGIEPAREGEGEPWSIAHMNGLLASCGDLAKVLRGVNWEKDTDVKREIKMALDGMRFRLSWVTASAPAGKGEQRQMMYGLEIIRPALEDKTSIRLTTRNPPNRKPTIGETSKTGGGQRFWFPSMPNELSLRFLALLFMVGLLALILVYENTIAPDTAFERFMDSQSFGVRILFTVFGTVISLFWGYYFSQTSESQIHRHLALSATDRMNGRQGLTPEQSIYLSPPSDVFVGLYRSVLHTRDFHSFNIALAALLAKFTPILLSNIPFYNTVTFKIHEACTWMAVVVLAYMVLVLAGGLMVSSGWSKTVNLPVKLDTMAGCMYYVCDSRLSRHAEANQEDGLGPEAEKRYFLGEMVGVVSGKKRVGLDYFHGVARS